MVLPLCRLIRTGGFGARQQPELRMWRSIPGPSSFNAWMQWLLLDLKLIGVLILRDCSRSFASQTMNFSFASSICFFLVFSLSNENSSLTTGWCAGSTFFLQVLARRWLRWSNSYAGLSSTSDHRLVANSLCIASKLTLVSSLQCWGWEIEERGDEGGRRSGIGNGDADPRRSVRGDADRPSPRHRLCSAAARRRVPRMCCSVHDRRRTTSLSCVWFLYFSHISLFPILQTAKLLLDSVSFRFFCGFLH